MIDTIEVVIGFPRHRKTRRLERALGNDARWLPVYLWLYTIENARDSGDLSHLTAEDLAAVLDYHGDATALRAALVAAEFLTADGHVVGWSDRYAQRFAFYERRARAAAEKRWGKRDDASSTPKASPSTQSQNHDSSVSIPDLTGPDLTLGSIAKHSSSMLEASKKHADSAESPLFGSEVFAQAWARWEQHRREIRKPLKPTMREAQLRELEAMGEARAIAALQFTIAKGWQGIREPDQLQFGPQRPAERERPVVC